MAASPGRPHPLACGTKTPGGHLSPLPPVVVSPNLDPDSTQEATPVRFKVPLASVVAATTIAGVAGAYAFVGGTALTSTPSSATVTASAGGLKASAAGAAAAVATSGAVPSARVELPIPQAPL